MVVTVVVEVVVIVFEAAVVEIEVEAASTLLAGDVELFKVGVLSPTLPLVGVSGEIVVDSDSVGDFIKEFKNYCRRLYYALCHILT